MIPELPSSRPKAPIFIGVCVAILFALWVNLGFTTSAAAYTLLNGDVGWDGEGLGHADLTYNLVTGTPDLSNEKEIIELALQQWASVADITFTETTTAGLDNSIDISFLSSTIYGFGTVGGVLGGAFAPDYTNSDPIAGDILLDDAETWLGGTTAPGINSGVGGGSEFDLYYVMLHEIGHALGLGHSLNDSTNLVAGSVMSPYYNHYGTGPGFASFDVLQADDIAGIGSIYGTRFYAGGSASPVPEPASLLLLSAGLSAMGYARARSAKSTKSQGLPQKISKSC